MLKVNIELVSQTEIELKAFDGGQPSAHTRLDAADVDRLIAVLSQLRTAMTPPVARTIAADALPVGPVDPLWAVPGTSPRPGKLLAIRHPGHGWLTFQFPPVEAAKLGSALIGWHNVAPLPPPEEIQ
jgi:hypothetical protein